MTNEQLLQQAMEQHGAGHLEEAGRIYHQILQLQPTHTDALYLLGLVAYQTGNYREAIGLIRRSLDLAPDQPQCHNVLGLALMETDKPEEAAASFGRAIAAHPEPEFYNNLGNLRKQQGFLTDAIAAYTEAVVRQPEYADAHYNLGNAYRAGNQAAAAEAAFRRAIEHEPNHANALAALGQVLQAERRTAEALPFLERAVALLREDADLYCDVGDCLQALGRRPEAVARYQKALRFNPKLARAWYAAGCAENAERDHASAMLCFRKALEIAPEWAEAHHNLGDALFNLGLVDEAVDHFRQAARAGKSELPRAMIAVAIPGAPGGGNQEILEARREWAERDLPPARPAARFEGRTTGAGRPLRIGYVSSFFHRHNWMKPVWALIHAHDRSRFEIHLFSDAPAAAIEHGYRAWPEDVFHDISGLGNEEAADSIEACGIDVLVDLNGYSKVRRLPLVALHPAPVVAGWFNMYATSGMAGYDYLIGDETVIPPAEEKFYCEKIARTPGSYMTFEVSYPVPDVAAPPSLTTGAITFGSLASQYKITPEVAAAWSAILRQAPGSRLILRNSALGSGGVRQFVERRFEQDGIARERVSLLGPADHDQFLKTYDGIDVALDTFPYNGGTTTIEAIWQGVPVITYWGDRWVARTSASLLRAGGLGEFVAGSAEEYVALAVRLANSGETPGYLGGLRREMRARLLGSAACDAERFARSMEGIYERMAGR